MCWDEILMKNEKDLKILLAFQLAPDSKKKGGEPNAPLPKRVDSN
jgi:hypothetical protein